MNIIHGASTATSYKWLGWVDLAWRRAPQEHPEIGALETVQDLPTVEMQVPMLAGMGTAWWITLCELLEHLGAFFTIFPPTSLLHSYLRSTDETWLAGSHLEVEGGDDLGTEDMEDMRSYRFVHCPRLSALCILQLDLMHIIYTVYVHLNILIKETHT